MGKIKGSEIIENNLFDNAAKSGKEFVEVLKTVEKELKDISKAQNKIAQDTGTKDFKSLQKKTKAINEVKTATDGLTRVQKSLKRAEEDLAVATTKEAKALAKTRAELNAVKKAQRDNIKATNESSNAYKKLTRSTNEAQANFKRLAAQFGVTSKQARRAKREFETLDNKLRKVNDAARDGRRDVGRYGKALSGLRSVALRLGLAFGGLRVIRNVFSTVADFEQSLASLSAITGATGKDLDFLKEKSIELSKASQKSAIEVAEAFKLIASAKPELLQDAEALALVTEQTIILSEAAKIDLTQAADAVTLSLNQFGEGAEKAAEFVDVLAAGSKFGAGNIEFINAALEKTGGAADAAGLSFASTVAAIETLAPVMATGEEAGTKFRNILANLQKEGVGFASGQFNLNDALAETNVRLNDIQDPSKKAAARIKLFGKQNDAAGIQLLNHIAALEEFQVSLNVSGIALEQQGINNDTLTDALGKLKNEWANLILEMSNGTGVFGRLKDAIFFVAKNLRTILKVVALGAISWGSYKLALKLVNRETGKFQRSGLLGFLGKMGRAIKLMTKGTRGAALGFKTMGRAIKSIPLAGLISGLVTAGTLLFEFIGGVDDSTDALNAEAEALERGNEQLTEKQRLLSQFNDEQKSIASQVKGRAALTKSQLTTLLSQTKAQLSVVTELGSAEAKNAAEQSDFIDKISGGYENRKQIEKELTILREKRTAADHAGDVQTFLALESQIITLKATAKTTKEADESRLKGVTITADAEKERNKETEHFIKLIEAELKLRGKVSTNSHSSLAKELTGLEDLRKKLRDIKKLRSDELVNVGATERFKTLSEQAAVMENQIRLYEEILKKANEVKKVEGRRKTDFGLDISIPQGLSDADAKAIKDRNDNTQKLIDDNEKRKQSFIDMADTISNALTVLNNVIQKKSQQRVEAFDREIQASQKAQDILRTIAQQGVADSEENLAFEQQKQAELEQRKQKEIERAANLELVLSAVSTFNAQVQAGATPAEALGSTAVTMTALEALVNGLDLFYEGTENTGTAANPLDSNGGRLAVLHDNERVITSAQNDVIGNMTNWELANMAGDYKDGSLTMQQAMVVQPFMGGQEILNKFDELKASIDNKPVMSDMRFSELEKSMVYTWEQKGKVKRNHVKTGGIW